MATSKISGMQALSVALTGSEETEVAKSNVSYRLSLTNLFKTIGVLPDNGGNPVPTSGYRIALYKISDGQPYSTTLNEALTGVGTVPAGGSAGQKLAKASGSDYDTEWVDDNADDQSANTVLAGPASGADAAPSYRALVDDDLPIVSVSKGGTGSSTASAARTALGLAIGTDVQAYSSVLAATTASFTTAQETKLGYISITQSVDLDAIESRVNALDAAVVLVGTWDASAGTFPGSGTAQAGESYLVTVGGTVDSVEFTDGDRIIAITDNASTTTYASNWYKADYTDRVSSVAGRTGAVTIASTDITDSTSTGRAVLTATDAAAARTAIGTVIGTDVQAYSSVLANTTASFLIADETKLDGIEAGADVTDEANVTAALSGATTTGVTPAAGDKVLLLDASDSDNLKHALFSSFTGGSGGGGNASYINNLTLAASVGSSALTIAVKVADGSTDPSSGDPISVTFRSSTAADGDYDTVSIEAALSLTISSGSTLGVTGTSIPFRGWVLLFNDAGTPRLGVVNCNGGTSIKSLDESQLLSSTAEGGAGAADSTKVIYTGSAVTNKAFRVLGYFDYASGLATAAGNWDAAPTKLQLFGPGTPLPGQTTGNMAQVIKTDTFTSTTASAYTDITDFSVSITPASACNLVKVTGGWNNIAGGANMAATRLVRGSTALVLGDAAGSRTPSTTTIFRTTDNLSVNFNGVVYLDFPQSASATTYKVQFYLQGGTYYFNRTILDSDAGFSPRLASQLLVEEIQG